MNKQNGIGNIGIILGFLGVLVISLGLGMGIGYFQDLILKKDDTRKSIDTPVACTQEAKICSDGSSVGRTGPNCEFSECPINNNIASSSPQVIGSSDVIEVKNPIGQSSTYVSTETNVTSNKKSLTEMYQKIGGITVKEKYTEEIKKRI